MGSIVGIGVDVVTVARIAAARRRHGDRFLRRVFTDGELAHSRLADTRDERVAARFAAKEAVMKALGTGVSAGVGFRQIEILSLPSGQPVVRLSGAAAARAQALGGATMHISMSDQGEWAAAMAILEGGDASP
jgi:holo-[acyl-carrier protein] synthase